MCETSGASFPGLDSEEVCNLPATETVKGSGETSRATSFQASADQEEAMSRQNSAAVPPRGDSLAHQGIDSRRAAHSRRSEREGSVSSSSQEGSRSSRSRLFGCINFDSRRMELFPEGWPVNI